MNTVWITPRDKRPVKERLKEAFELLDKVPCITSEEISTVRRVEELIAGCIDDLEEGSAIGVSAKKRERQRCESSATDGFSPAVQPSRESAKNTKEFKQFWQNNLDEVLR